MPADDRELYLMLGEIKGAQEALTGEVRAGNTSSSNGIRRLHDTIDDLRERNDAQFKEMADKNEEQFQKLSTRIHTAQRTAEGALNQVTTVAPTVTEHENLKLKAEGASVAVAHFGKILWLFGGTVIASVVSVTAFIIHLLTSGPPPKP